VDSDTIMLYLFYNLSTRKQTSLFVIVKCPSQYDWSELESLIVVVVDVKWGYWQV